MIRVVRTSIWRWPGIPERDRRTLVIGILVIAILFLTSRGLPAWRRWDSYQRATAAEIQRQLTLAMSNARHLSTTRDSASARLRRVDALRTSLVPGETIAEAGAALASLISDMADASNVRVVGISVRSDSTRGALARVAVRVAALSDVEGLVEFLRAVEQDESLLAVRELSVDQADVAAPDTRAEVLRIDLYIEALAAVSSPARTTTRLTTYGVITPTQPSTVPAQSSAALDSLDIAAEAIVANDPFRLANAPATVRFVAGQSQTIATPALPAPRPNLVLRAIVGGPPWQAVLDGLPGQPTGTVVTGGGSFDGIRIRAITRDTVVVESQDTTWKLTLKRGTS